MVGVHQALIAAFLHRAVAGERIGDRPADDREGQRGVSPRQRDRCIAGVAGAERIEQQQMSARRRAETTHKICAGGERFRIRLQKPDAEIHIGDGFRIAHRRRHAEVDGQHDDAVGRQIFADRHIVQPIAHSPCPAVHFEHRGERTGSVWAVEAGEQRRSARRAEIF